MSETPTPEPMPLRKAMERAFHLGQTYWQQADHHFLSQQRKSDATREGFREFADATCAQYDSALTAERAAREKAEEVANAVTAGRYSAMMIEAAKATGSARALRLQVFAITAERDSERTARERAEAERVALRTEVERLREALRTIRAEVLEEVLRKLPAARDVNGEANDWAQGWRAGVLDCDTAIRAAKEGV